MNVFEEEGVVEYLHARKIIKIKARDLQSRPEKNTINTYPRKLGDVEEKDKVVAFRRRKTIMSGTVQKYIDRVIVC